MEVKMLYYVGKGTELKKEDCKEYKTIANAKKAAEKDESLNVWDENGQEISLTGEAEPATAAAVSENAEGNNEAGESAEAAENGTNDDKTENESSESENRQNEADTASGNEENIDAESENDDKEQEVIIPQGTMRVTVVCDGALNIRRSAAWGNENICGRAVRGQSYYVKAIRTVDGKKMVQTIEDLYLSGESDHVQFEQL